MASVFEFSVLCLLVCSLSVGNFSNFVLQYKAAGIRKNVVRMNNDIQYGTFSLSTVVIRYSMVHYSTVQYSTVQYSTVQYITVQYSI